MLSAGQRKLVTVLLVVLFLGGGVLSEVLRPGHDEYMRAGRVVNPGSTVQAETNKSWLGNTSFQALIPTVLGVREVLASLMWVRADSYFHTGEYRPILTMVRQIVAIDPHQLDVYATGAWHMAYNFLDKRLIEDGVQFLEEGCRNNDNVYDLFFELGYMHYDKTKRYHEAVRAYAEGAKRGTTTGKPMAPAYVRHQLAHAREKSGDIDACIRQWQENYDIGVQLRRQGEPEYGPMSVNLAACEHNLYITRRRMHERLALIAERERNAPRALELWRKNVRLAEEWLDRYPGHGDVTKDLGVAKAQVTRLERGELRPSEPVMIEVPFTVTRVAPRKLEIAGKINVLDLSRIHIRFEDTDYERRAATNVFWKMENCTREWDNISIRKGAFKWLLDMDRDPADMGRQPSDIYPLKADTYTLTLRYNPRLQAAFIQDRYGWNGEGITARPGELVEDRTEMPGRIDGKIYPLRMFEKKITLKREDILAPGKKVLYTSR